MAETYTLHRHHETALAILVSDDGDEKSAVWLPRSKIEIVREIDGETIEVEVPDWLAEERGLA